MKMLTIRLGPPPAGAVSRLDAIDDERALLDLMPVATLASGCDAFVDRLPRASQFATPAVPGLLPCPV
jgi:hypothetical protein